MFVMRDSIYESLTLSKLKDFYESKHAETNGRIQQANLIWSPT